MKCRKPVLGLIVLVLLLVTAGSIVVLSPDRDPPQDVFLIVLDTVRRDALGCYGNPNNPTPHLDALAADGARFNRAITTSGWTLPSVASLLTSTLPTVHGANGKVGNLTRIRDEVPTGPEILRKIGFRTAGFANSAFLSPMVGVARGFDLFDSRCTYNQNYRRADETIDDVLPVLRRNASGRNFFMVHLFDGHLDYDPPQEHLARFVSQGATPRPPISHEYCHNLLQANRGNRGGGILDHVRRVYHGEIGFVDAEVGRLVQSLKDQGRYEDATIVVVADHGEEFLDHGGFEHGHTLYDELIRVPLIIKSPRSFGAQGTVIETQVRILDVMPTIFELCQVPSRATFNGLSLLPMILGRGRAPRFAFAEGTLYGPDRISGSDGRFKVLRTAQPEAGDVIELYDLTEDPSERNNLARVLPDLAMNLLEKLDAFRQRLDKTASSMSLPERVNLDPDNIEKLRSLGYLR